MNDYIFDVFPIHPAPQPLEALSSYLSRLAVANTIHTCSAFLRWVFPDRKRFAHHITDFPVSNWGALPTVACLNVTQLQALTFHNLGLWFGQPTFIGSSYPLNACVASHFRYCPCCLAEQGYAPLTWRVTLVRGCCKHNIVLHDTCPHCQHLVPLMRTSSMSRCPSCDGNLCDAPVIELTEDEARLVRVRTADLTVLLQPPLHTPIPWRNIRENFGVSLGTMARSLGSPKGQIQDMEAGRRPMDLPRIFQYCDRLGICLRDVLAPETVLPHERSDIAHLTTVAQTALENQARLGEANLLQAAQHVTNQLRTSGESVTVTALARHLKMHATDLNNYPDIRSWLDTVRQQRYAHRASVCETELLAQLKAVSAPILACDTPFRVIDICAAMGASHTRLRGYPKVATYLDKLVDESQQRRYPQPHALLNQLEDTIASLQAQGVEVTQAELQAAGLPMTRLRHYTLTRNYLADFPPESSATVQQKKQRELEQRTRQKVLSVLPEMVKKPVRLTLSMVAQAAGVSPTLIRQQPELLAAVNDAIAKTPFYALYTPQEVEEITRNAVEYLHQQGISPTFSNIQTYLQWPLAFLQNYPESHAATKSVLVSYRARKRQYELDNLFLQVRQYLQQHHTAISFTQLARELSCTRQSLMEDKRISQYIQQFNHDCRATDAQRLWQQVQEVVFTWQAHGKRISQQTLSQHLHVSRYRLNAHPDIVALLADVRLNARAQRQQYQDDLTQRAQQFVLQCQREKRAATRKSIAEHLNVSADKLDGYPGIRMIFDELHIQRIQETTERECDLLKQIEFAICTLQQGEEPVTQKSIAACLGRSPAGLKHYPRVRQRLQEVIQANQKR